MPQESVNWHSYGYKHRANNNANWSELVKLTKDKPAKYHPNQNGRILEEAVVEWKYNHHQVKVLVRGREIEKESCEFLYSVFGEIVGASDGKPTRIVRVQWDSDGTLHGRPISEEELKRELSKKNPDEVEWLEMLMKEKKNDDC